VRVCALPSGQVEAALSYLGCRSRVLALDPRTLEEVLGSILAVGQAAGVPGRKARGGLGPGFFDGRSWDSARLCTTTARSAGTAGWARPGWLTRPGT